ncbi:MAG TPA: pitrilysin family protein [Saprospiraceae bacterium]|nr:pitrilysin family protein [Saprospiraceae bacterium]
MSTKSSKTKPSLIIGPPDWDIRFPEFQHLAISNGSSVYTMTSNKPKLCYFEFVFENGRVTEHKKLASRVTVNQIQEGTLHHTSKEIADFFDFYGCSYSIHADLDFTVIAVSCLQRHVEKVIHFVIELLTEPIFPEENLQKAKVFYISQLQHQLSEPDFVSYREFTAQVYGPDSIYGYNSEKETFEALIRNDLIQYHRDHFTAERLKVFYCGDPIEHGLNFWEETLRTIPKQTQWIRPPFIIPEYQKAKAHFPMSSCMQISLKYGKKLFPKTHPDYFGMYMVNTILGDYFGSRLMKNIREEHGFTYDIHSTIDAQLHDGCFYISAELNAEFLDETIAQINKEIKKLKEEAIPDFELNMVKNYLNGHVLRLVDGSFPAMQFLKILITEFNTVEAFQSLVHKIKTIDQQEIMELSEKYLCEDDMTVITAGA